MELDEFQKQKSSLHDFLERGVYDIDTFMERQNSIVKRLKKAKEEITQLQKEINNDQQLSEQFNERYAKC